jgi:hypothetical protein
MQMRAQYVHSFFSNRFEPRKGDVSSNALRNHNPRVGGSNPSTATIQKAL